MHQAAQPAPPHRNRWAAFLFAGATIAVAGCVQALAPTATVPLVSAAPASPTATHQPSGPSPSTGAAFGDAWIAVVETYDARAVALLISNPLSEYDLVGARLIELLEQTIGELSSLGPPVGLNDELLALDAAMAATLTLLKDIDPHGPRPDQAEAYQRALDDWIEHVRPHAELIREVLGLSPVPPGDLQL